jgi:hypothetical protein
VDCVTFKPFDSPWEVCGLGKAMPDDVTIPASRQGKTHLNGHFGTLIDSAPQSSRNDSDFVFLVN